MCWKGGSGGRGGSIGGDGRSPHGEGGWTVGKGVWFMYGILRRAKTDETDEWKSQEKKRREEKNTSESGESHRVSVAAVTSSLRLNPVYRGLFAGEAG